MYPSWHESFEELERGELVLELGEPVVALLLGEGLVVLDGLELRLQPVEEERVDEPVDILHRRVVHAALAPLVMRKRLLHQTAEDDGADVLPLEPLARMNHRVPDFVGELRNLYRLGEQAAVDVVERGEVILKVLVPLRLRGVEHLEQVDDCTAQVAGVVAFDVVAECVRWEQSGVFGVQEEHDAHRQHCEAVVCLGVVGVGVLLGQGVVQVRHEDAGVLG